MGCGASREDPNNNGVPTRLRPILRQRLDEMRARREHHAQTAPKDDIKNSPSPIHQGNDPQFQDCSSNFEKNANNPSPKSNEDDGDDEELTFRPLMIGEKEGNEGKIGEKTEEAIKGSCVEVKEEGARVLVSQYSSPSFRVYCSTSCSSIDTNPMLSDSEEFEGFSDSEYKTTCHSISTNEESIGSNHEASIKNQNKKNKRGRRFTQIMAKGGKNRFHMHSFLHHNIKHNKLSDNPQILQTTVA